jgi:CoA:oxalate CoA-transferase
VGTTHSLEGIRVLDLSRVLAGPFCARILGDLGAEVIKVESPHGDDSRIFGPFVDGESAYFRLFNRNKLGVTLDLKSPEDLERVLGLVRRADVLIENFRPGVMDRLGLSPERLQQENPRLVVLSLTGFGQQGPLRGAPAYDLVAQAMSGIMAVTGWPGGEPTRVGVSIGDLVPGLYGVIAVLGALQERARTGRGQHVDLAMLDCLMSMLESVAMRAMHGGEEPTATGNDHAMTAPFSTYRTADGSVAIAVSNDKLFTTLALALSRAEWLDDPRFNTYDARNPHRSELRTEIELALAGMSTATALERLRACGVPAAKVLSVHEALEQEHALDRGAVVSEPDGFRTLGSPLHLTGAAAPTPAPRLGEHNHLLAGWLALPEVDEQASPERT